MNTIFRSFTFRWWQLALYETALISLGLGVGSIWSDTFEDLAPWLLLVFICIAPYILYLYLDQVSQKAIISRKDDPRDPSQKEGR
ncbi:MAG: hypothetical protein WDZ82_01765 [Candidatus Paceibacterota bacterium]